MKKTTKTPATKPARKPTAKPAKPVSGLQTRYTDAPLSQDFRVERNALLVPWGSNPPSTAQRAAGVFDAQGGYIPQSQCLRFEDGAVTVQPEYDAEAPVETLNGRYLFGGMLYGHFGHFLCESTARLWALAQLQGLDGVVWLPKPPLGHPAKLVKPYVPFMAALGHGDLTLIAPQKNTRIEEIVFVEQGFGIGTMSSGRPEYRAFMRGNLGAAIAADGPERLYISRADLPTKRGSVLLETRIEALLAAEGYTIFHPQNHGFAEQIARYKAAKRIIGLDGSALHLAAMVLRPDAKVAIINRGPSQNIDDYLRQFEAFAGVLPTRVEAIRAYWFAAGKRVVKRETHALLDLTVVGAALQAAGMITAGDWPAVAAADLAAEIAEREARGGAALQRYDIEKAV